MADKTIANGTLLKYDEDGNGTGHSTIGEITNITPPGRTRDDVDVTDVADTFVEYEPSIPDYGELTFEQLWHAGDSNHELIDTAFANAPAARLYEWQIVYPYSTPVTDEFTGYVKAISPTSIGPKDSIKRTVTIKLTSDITRT